MLTTVTVTTTLAASVYPVDFMTALITISAALMAVAGIIIAVVASREDLQQTGMGKFVISVLSYSVIPGIFVMFLSLDWFTGPSNAERIIAIVLMIVQFILIYIPLYLFGRGIVFIKKGVDKPRQPPQ
jgi:hypothetical protein